MARRALLFRKTDAKRLVEAVTSAGITVARVELGTDGKIIVVAREHSADDAANAEPVRPAEIVL
jgi:hypothetical protein